MDAAPCSPAAAAAAAAGADGGVSVPRCIDVCVVQLLLFAAVSFCEASAVAVDKDTAAGHAAAAGPLCVSMAGAGAAAAHAAA